MALDPKRTRSAEYDPVYEPKLSHQLSNGEANNENYETPLSPDDGYFLLENATTPEIHSRYLTESKATPAAYEIPSPRNPKSATSSNHGYDFPFPLDEPENDTNYETPHDADDTTKL